MRGERFLEPMIYQAEISMKHTTITLAAQERREALAGWLMAGPAIILIAVFLITPFFMAFGLSFTNQRLVSPNPAEFVGLRNFQRMLTVRTLTLDPLSDASTGAYLRDEDGALVYPQLRDFTRSDEYPQYKGMRELTSFSAGMRKLSYLQAMWYFSKPWPIP